MLVDCLMLLGLHLFFLLSRKKRETGKLWLGEKKNGYFGLFDPSNTESFAGENLESIAFVYLVQ